MKNASAEFLASGKMNWRTKRQHSQRARTFYNSFGLAGKGGLPFAPGLIFSLLLLGCLGFLQVCYGASPGTPKKQRLLVVDSYHREYLWSQHVAEGFCAALREFGFLENAEQVKSFAQTDFVESSTAVVKRVWMDTKRKQGKRELAEVTTKITEIAQGFTPDLIFLGDDNAANYIGNQFLDTNIPLVFWGVNYTPVKYGLVDDAHRPGHNVTGVYQTTYYKESLQLLKTIVPRVRTFAVLSDDTTTGRIHSKAIEYMDRKGQLPLKLIETVATNDYDVWKRKALDLQDKVDAFFIASSNGLKDRHNITVSNKEVARWYISQIRIPEATGFKYRVEPGWLCAADDSGYNQGYEAVAIARDILIDGADPAVYPPRTPKRGPLMVNRQRAQMLGITLTDDMGIEVYIEKASALDPEASIRKKKLMVVNSYHKAYFGSEEAQAGLCAALVKFGYFGNQDEIDRFRLNDDVETARAEIKQVWMDTKRKTSKPEIHAISLEIYKRIKAFDPDILLLGEDNAANYIGRKFLDSKLPVVFWGVNNSPVKYGLVDREDRPGHNVTGVYQSGRYIESLMLLKLLQPNIQTIGVISDPTPSGRSHQKKIEFLARKGRLPVKLVEVVAPSSFSEWKDSILDLQQRVDAFFVAQYSGLKDNAGQPVSHREVTQWYLTNVKIPEAAGFRHLVEKGLLCCSDDSVFDQGYEAGVIAHDILALNADPATYPPRTPQHGRLILNRERAHMLGLAIPKSIQIQEYIDKIAARDN